MALRANKRRKTDHVASKENGYEDTSFASFSDVESDEAESDVRDDGDNADSEVEISLNGFMDNEDDNTEDSNGEEDIIQMSASAVKNHEHMKAKQKLTAATKSNGRVGHDTNANAFTNGTFKSNVFKLQVDELLAQVRPRHGKRESQAEHALHVIKKSIEQISARGPYTLADAERDLIKEKVAIPFPDPQPPRDAKYKFAFAKPTNINVAGSFASKTSSRIQSLLEIDMVVRIPDTIFQEKDFLNYRYFYKRAYYLACIASGLKAAHQDAYSLCFKLMHDDCLKPVLVVSPINEPLPKWCVNIIPYVAEEQFAAAKLRPENNCLRTQVSDNEETHEVKPMATTAYNSSLRADMLVTSYLKLLHNATKSCGAFVDACLLGGVWLRQRGFTSSINTGGFGNFEWKVLLALCLQGGGAAGKALLSPGYSSYQLFKAVLQLIATKDLSKQPLLIGTLSSVTKIGDGLPLVWDAERGHNILYKVQPAAYNLLRYEARTTIGALGDLSHDGFDSTFILQVREPLYRFDQIISIPLQSIQGQSSLTKTQDCSRNIYQILKRGLGDRVFHIFVSLPAAPSWKLGSSLPRMKTTGDITIGLVINPDAVKRLVDHGPSAENKNAVIAFREFWGDRAELRRFKDGSILESLLWKSPQDSGQSVTEQIARYTLARHAGLVAVEDLRIFGDEFSGLIQGGTHRTVFEPLLTQYNRFENDLRDLRDLPLTIRQIMPADPQLRCASLYPPIPGVSTRRSRPSDVILQFEGSGRWPDDLAAIQRTKIAFLLMIDEMLQESVDSVYTRIGLENEGQEVLNQAFLDVTYDSEATFRLRIYHDREQTLHERRLKDKSVDPKAKEISATGLSKYKRDYAKTPALTQAISRLCIRFPALTGSIRLVKRWFAAHLLSNHIADEVIELLVARTFVQSWPWQTPSSAQTGFLRTLFWISRWDWRASPLVVDLSASGDLKPADIQTIDTNFKAWRKLDPAMNRVTLFVASNLDHDGNTWTDGQPAKVVAGRMTGLAKAACAEISEKGLQLDPPSLFSSPLGDFDFILHISPRFTGAKSRKQSTSGAITFKNLELDADPDDTSHGFDPVRDFLGELEELYGSAILFFYGGVQNAVIAGLWSPLTARRSWKVNLAYSTVPRTGPGAEDDVQADLNKNAVLAEMARIGGDMIEKFEVFGH